MLTAGVFGDGDTLQQRLSFRDRLELEFDTAGWSSNARNWLYSMAWANASTADPSTARHAVAEAYRALRKDYPDAGLEFVHQLAANGQVVAHEYFNCI